MKEAIHLKNQAKNNPQRTAQNDEDDDDPFAAAMAPTHVACARHPNVQEQPVGRLNISAPAALPFRGVPAKVAQERRQQCIQFLARASVGNALIVDATRKYSGNRRPEWRSFPAKLVQKPRTTDGGDYVITFDEDDGHFDQPAYNLLEQHNDVVIHSFHLVLDAPHGLPPLDPQRHGTNLMQQPARTIFVGIHAGNGTEAAAAIVVRKPDRENDNKTWKCEMDLAVPPLPWDGDKRLGRTYAGGTKKAIGSIALEAALKAAAKELAELNSVERQYNGKIAIVVEPSAAEALEQMFTFDTKNGPQRIKGGPDATKQFHQQRLNLHKSFTLIAPHVLIASSNYSAVASCAAQLKLTTKPSIGEKISELEAELFRSYNHSLVESKQRHRQQQQNRDCGPAQTTINSIAAEVKDYRDFVDLCRGNRARDYVPHEALAPIANIVHAQLRSIIDAPHKSVRRDDALIGLLLLPAMHLPVGGRSKQIVVRAAAQRPWNMQLSEKRQQQRQREQQVPRNGGEDAAVEVDGSTEEEQAAEFINDAFAIISSTEGGVELIGKVNQVTDGSKEQNDERTAAQEELDALVAEEALRLLRQRRATQADKRDTWRKKKFERLAEAVERLANDFKMRSARKMLFTVVENDGKPDMPFEEKFNKLREKVKSTSTPLPDMKLDEASITAPFPRELVKETVSKMPKQAATCVDAWNRRIIEDCAKVLPEIYDLFGTVCADINNGKFGERVYSILRLGRLVGIPKDDGGVRPLSLTCFLLKLTGALIWRGAGGHIHLYGQYAINMPDGTLRIVHPIFEERKAGNAIIKIDVSGAFDTARRAEIAEILISQMTNAEGKPIAYARDMCRYFNTMYGAEEQMAVYGPDGRTEYITVNEGVRQGDAFSGYFFALIMERVCRSIEAACPGVIIRCYMDDLTLVCLPRNAKWVMAQAMTIMSEHGFKCNPDKSRILANKKDEIRGCPIVPMSDDDLEAQIEETKDAIVTDKSLNDVSVDGRRRVQQDHRDLGDQRQRDWHDVLLGEQREKEKLIVDQIIRADMLYFYARQNFEANTNTNMTEDANALRITQSVVLQDNNESFVVLGANVSDNFDEYNEKQRKRLCGFFDVMDKIELHPQLAFTLARICGFVKARYYASVTPPEHSLAVLQAFVKRTVTYLEKLFKFKIEDQEFCHHYCGLGIPDYVSARIALYHDARNAAIRKLQCQQVSLVNRSLKGVSAAHFSAQQHAPWLAYQPRGHDMRMAPSDFRIAMAIRCRTLPDNLAESAPAVCRCTHRMENTGEVIDHALNCQNTGYSPAIRHTAVKMAICAVMRRYSLQVASEPTVYCNSYEDKIRHRPDILAWNNISVATDVVVVQQHGNKPGAAAAKAADKKNKLHSAVAAKHGHMFFPFALESHGYMHPSCMSFIENVAQHLPAYQTAELQKEMIIAISTTLARARVHAVAALLQHRDAVLLDGNNEGDDADVTCDIAAALSI